MEKRELKEVLGKLATALGHRYLERLVSQLDPDQLVERASEVLGVELREVLNEIFRDADLAPLRELIDRLYEDLDTDQIIDAIARPLATDLAEWFKDEGADYLAGAIVEELDLRVLAEMVADRVASRVQIVPE